MDTILGMKLDKVLINHGVDHDKISAELIMDNKKIGEVINDGWCDSYFIEFYKSKYENEFLSRMECYYKHKGLEETQFDNLIKELLFISKEYTVVKNKKMKVEQFTFLWK